MTLLLLIGVFVACILVGAPLFVALGLANAIVLMTLPMQSVIPLAASSVANLDAFVLVAVPLFLLMGHIMTEGGLTSRLINVSNVLVGRFRGGLAMSNTTSALLMSGVSGSSLADVVAIGTVMIPAMKAQGYSAAFSSALTAAAALLGPTIPPSILLILFGVQAQVSITHLFLAGIVPGLLIAGGMLVYIYVLARTRNFPVFGKVTATQALAAFREGALSLIAPVIIVLGIVYGIFTVTESAAIAVLYSLFLTVILYRSIGGRALGRALLRTAHDTGIVMILVGISSVTAWIIALDGTALDLVKWLVDAGMSKWLVLLAMNALLLLIGLAIEPAPGLLLVIPLLIPVAKVIGLDPVHLGIIITINLTIGLLTPPVAIANLLTARIAGITLKEQQKEIWPLLALMIAILLLTTYIPALSLWLPRVLLN